MVSKTNFTCQRLLLISASSQTILPENRKVSNSLIIPDAISEEKIQCMCRAVWGPQEDLYTKTTCMQFLIRKDIFDFPYSLLVKMIVISYLQMYPALGERGWVYLI